MRRLGEPHFRQASECGSFVLANGQVAPNAQALLSETLPLAFVEVAVVVVEYLSTTNRCYRNDSQSSDATNDGSTNYRACVGMTTRLAIRMGLLWDSTST